MGEKGVGKLSRETPPPREGEPMGARSTCRVSSGPQRKREVAKRRLVQKRNIGERPV